MCVLDYVPFVHKRKKDEEYTVDIKGMIQSLIASSIIGLLLMYGTQQAIKVQIDTIRDDVQRVERAVEDIRRDVYIPRHKKDGF